MIIMCMTRWLIAVLDSKVEGLRIWDMRAAMLPKQIHFLLLRKRGKKKNLGNTLELNSIFPLCIRVILVEL